jgi:flotillin
MELSMVGLSIVGLFIAGLVVLGVGLLLAILFRRVVSTNVVHIVQRGRTTVPYGTGLAAGNVSMRGRAKSLALV